MSLSPPLPCTDPRELEQFTRHVLGLGLGEQLVPLLSALEEEHRERLHPAEEELEGGGGGEREGGVYTYYLQALSSLCYEVLQWLLLYV